MTRGEIYVEPCNNGVNEVTSSAIQSKGNLECKLRWFDSIEIDRQDGCWVSDTGLNLDGIH